MQDDLVMWGGCLGIFLIVFGVAALAVEGAAKRIFRLDQDSRAPRLTVEASVAGRRQEYRFYGTRYRRTRSTTYYAAFQLKNGARVEVWMSRRNYRRLTEDSFGLLTYQGSRFVRFERLGKQVTG